MKERSDVLARPGDFLDFNTLTLARTIAGLPLPLLYQDRSNNKDKPQAPKEGVGQVIIFVSFAFEII